MADCIGVRRDLFYKLVESLSDYIDTLQNEGMFEPSDRDDIALVELLRESNEVMESYNG